MVAGTCLMLLAQATSDPTVMDPINSLSSEYKQLQEYILTTHSRTHTTIHSPTIQHAFRVERNGEGEAWCNEGYDRLEDGARLLLWHGSRSMNFGGTSIPMGGCRCQF